MRGLQFRKPADEAAQLVPPLRTQADMVIAATHMGHFPDGHHGINAPGDVEMARQVQGLDLIVGGHSQNPVCMLAENIRNTADRPGQPCAPDRQNGAWIVQAHEWVQYVGRADFVVDAGQVNLVTHQLIPINLKQAGADGKKVVVVGQTDGVFNGDRVRVRSQPTTLGMLIARAMRERTGAELLDWLGAAAKLSPGSGGYPQTAGLQWRVADGPVLEARVGGQPIDRSRRDTLAINNFTAIGGDGDGDPKMDTHPGEVNTGLNDAEVLRTTIAARSPLKLAEFAPDHR